MPRQVLVPKVLRTPVLPAQRAFAQIEAKPTISVLGRLQIFIADPSVSTINCPGPGKQITITKFGIPQPTSIALDREEIKSFLKELSDRTRIPLLPGIFKVIYQNIIVTAVVSDYIETKFIIEKKFAPILPLPGQAFQPVRAQFR